MKPQARTTLASLLVALGVFILGRFLLRHLMKLRRQNLKLILRQRISELRKLRRKCARSWALRVPLRRELAALERRYNDYFCELFAHLHEHERELLKAHYREAEIYLKDARRSRRLGQFSKARRSVRNADDMIDRACRCLAPERLVVWSEVCFP